MGYDNILNALKREIVSIYFLKFLFPIILKKRKEFKYLVTSKRSSFIWGIFSTALL